MLELPHFSYSCCCGRFDAIDAEAKHAAAIAQLCMTDHLFEHPKLQKINIFHFSASVLFDPGFKNQAYISSSLVV